MPDPRADARKRRPCGRAVGHALLLTEVFDLHAPVQRAARVCGIQQLASSEPFDGQARLRDIVLAREIFRDRLRTLFRQSQVGRVTTHGIRVPRHAKP